MESSDLTKQADGATPEPDAATDVSIIGSTLLCSDCRVLFTTEKILHTLKSKPGLRFTRSRRKTLRNAIDGCRLCQEILCIPYNYVTEYWQRVEREQGQNASKSLTEKEKGWPVDLWKSELSLLEPRDSKSKAVVSDRDMNFSLKGDPNSASNLMLTKHRSLWFAKKMQFMMSADKNDVVAAEVAKRVRNRSLESDATYDEIRNLLLYRSQLDAQGGTGSSFTPSYLLNVDHDGRVRLCRSRLNAKYVALSFAWGATQTMTTESNLDAHLQRIDFDTLSKTVQDAVLVTRKLKLRYLWVDALCMIQDSDEDKMKQTPLLGQIFHNAYVSIIANCAKTCNEGFLEEARVRKRFQMPYCDENGQTGQVWLAALKPFKATTETQWLQTRAWAYQELCLSRRIILYDSYQINWSCFRDLVMPPGIHGWVGILRTFSSKELTDSYDKLPAISSLAAHYHHQFSYSRYLAGIFSAKTHHQLCWYGTTGHRLSRPQVWRAPSWSPMAVDGPTEQWHCWTDTTKVVPFLVDNDGEYHADFVILDGQVEVLKEEARYGRVVSGFIQVKGRLMPIRKDKLRNLSGMGNLLGGLGVPMQSQTTMPGRVGTMYFDTVNSFGKRIPSADCIQSNHGPLMESTELACLAICKKKVVRISTDSDTKQTTYTILRWDAGLVLAKLENGDYHRVGHFICNKKNVFPGSYKLEVLRIV